MAMDPDVSSWILGYLLRQPLEEKVLNSLLLALPIPEDDPKLQKTVLLKKLESGVSLQSVSESTLVLLEQLEEVELLQENQTVSDAMKDAYCAVAVECTVKILKGGDDVAEDKKLQFSEAVRSVWVERIGRMKKEVDKVGLGSEQLWEWKQQIEAAVLDDGASNKVVERSEKVDGVAAVNAYIEEEREKMGPPVLDMVAKIVKKDKRLQGLLGLHPHPAGKESSPPRTNANIGEHLGSSSSSQQRLGFVKEPALKRARRNPAQGFHFESNSFVVDDAGVVRAGYRREDPIESAQEYYLHTPRTRRNTSSPLNEYEMKPIKQRRVGRKWSLLEEHTLASQVNKFGRGNWKFILSLNQDIFEGRTEVDLKDKWRNLDRNADVATFTV